ncbi:MAG: biotin--[acetyl-CoA-carboxylase] ligase [Planctomycetes bacterium]|nr:biotin--[acetyl-CoA-carboxylase] ligase [Planctomycetota bacterium]MBT4029106.1 biotin--[acetyl-CoA-carboxylase] ligase [Planctomycetota bacterium]MBT4560484.1 biotin--[acetyl-CoA-carboxylase] ligase [Planctomycetota bacterium]MBT5102157.1 biotin--[acetyl-CoA-carboxylase] ligase [Planctomycetota bacterium]MBT5119420.1 biotin--[acetyl-CoA-carboxylase] ligase [Planctomycetota bacterium]
MDLARLQRMLPARRRLARQVRIEASCPSTSDIVKQMAASKGSAATDGLLVLAEEQTSGRGRRSRDWWTGPPHANLALSIGLATPLPQPVEALGLLAACALTDVVERTVAAPVAMKWPNDVLIGQAKIAGLLCEMPAQIDHFAIIGIGINVHAAPPPQALAYEASCIDRHAPTGRVDRTLLLAGLLIGLERRLRMFQHAGPSALEAEMLKRLRAWAPHGVRDPRTETVGLLQAFSFQDGLTIRAQNTQNDLPLAWLSSLERLRG